jgi:hypothetical protein
MGPLRLIWRLIGCIKNLVLPPDVRRLVVTRRLLVTYPPIDWLVSQGYFVGARRFSSSVQFCTMLICLANSR